METIPTIILCGGKGIRLYNESNYIPKAMVSIGHKPVVWHVMKRYSLFGHTDFILALGEKGEQIRNYFLQYEGYTNDVAVSLGERKTTLLSHSQEENWNVILTDTGDNAQSGARIARCKSYIQGDEFMVTYSDTVADVDIQALLAFHRKNKKLVTVTGVHPPYRETEFLVKNNIATGFYDATTETKQTVNRYIHGGYMVCNREIFDYLSPYSECRLESDIFPELVKTGNLAVYPHHGFWRWLDTDRDYHYVNELVDKNEAYWLQKKGTYAKK